VQLRAGRARSELEGKLERVSLRRRQGAVLIAGGAVLYLLVEVGDLRFHWTPLLVGLSYLVAAVVGGKPGSYWATACVITAWGAGVVLHREGTIDVSPEGAYLLAIGVGATVAALLGRSGYAVDGLGIAASILLAGLFLALVTRVDAVGRASTYAAALALIGLIRLASPEGRLTK